MNSQEEQQGGSQLLNMMKKNYEKEQDDDTPSKFSQNFHPLNSESMSNNINSDNTKNKIKPESDPNYDDFLNAGGDKLISGLNKLNLGNISSNPNTSPKKPEMNNFFQNPMMNMNLTNKNNQKDLAFNYYFGNTMQNDQTKKENETGGQNVSSKILEHLRFNQNIPNMDNDINEPQFKNYFNNKVNDNNQNEDVKIEKDIYNKNNNNINMNPNEQEKILLNMNFQNNNRQRIGLNVNENMTNNQNNNKINNINNINMNKQMMQMNNNLNNINMGGAGNIQFNNMDPRIRNMIQQKIIQQNLMMGNNNMQINPNQNQLLMNNQNNMQQNQKNMNQNNKNKKKKNKNKSNNNNNNNLNNLNMNLIMNQQQQQNQMLNYQNYNQFMHKQNLQNNNPMMNYSSPQNQNQLNFNNNNRFIPNNMNNIQNYNMNIPPQQKNFMPPQMQNEGYLQNNLSMQILNNNMNMNNNYHQVTLDQLINRANNTFPGKFFVIKSIDEANILSSIRFKIWCSTIKGNQKLQKAYKEADKKYPIFLFFSVNSSGKFMGIALMKSDVENKVNFNYWSQSDKWKGFFMIEWICIKDVPNRMFRSIINELNEGKPVTSSRDTQEIATAAGVKMLKVFKDYPQESTIFDSQTNEMKYMFQQQNEHNNMGNMNNNIPNMGSMTNMGNMNNMNMNNMGNIGNNVNNNLGNIGNNVNNNFGNIGNMNNMSNIGNMNNMNNMNNLNNVNNIGNIQNIGNANINNYNQMIKMNSRNMEQNFGNNNMMNINNINLRENNLNINNNLNNPNPNTIPGVGDMNNFGKLQMEMNAHEKNEEQKDNIKNNMNEQYDFNNILQGKNDEDDGEDENK